MSRITARYKLHPQFNVMDDIITTAPPEILIPAEFARLFDADWREAAVYGGRNSLKSHTVARILLIRAMQQRTRVFCGREFQNSIADSSHQLLKDLIDYYQLRDFKVTDNSIVNTANGSDFLFKGIRLNIQSIKSIEGIDLAWIEEAQTISDTSIEVLTPTVRKPGSQIIWTYNRLTEDDPVHKRLVKEGRPNTLILNVNYDVAMKYGWMSDDLVAEMEDDKIKRPGLYANKWLGEPLQQGDKAILSRDAVVEAMNRRVDEEGAIEIGVDVARFGDDRTVMVKRKGHQVIAAEEYTKKSTTEVRDLVAAFADQDKKVLIKVDDTGVGGGVTDGLIEMGYTVMPVNFGAKAHDSDKYPNLISEAWFHLESIITHIGLHNDNELLGELTTRQWVMDSKGRRGVESKDVYKKRDNRSPDKADATILCFYDIAVQPFPDQDGAETAFGSPLTAGLMGQSF